MVFCNLLPFAGSQSIRNRLRVGKELPAGAERAGVGEGSGAVDGCFLPRDQRLLHPPSLAETLPSSAVALVRLVPSGRARTRCGVSGAGLGGLRGCSARCSGHVPGVALVPIPSGWDGGHKLCPLEDLGPVPPFVLPGPGDRSGCACSPPLSAALPPQG